MTGQDDRSRFKPANDADPGGSRGPKNDHASQAMSKEELDKELQEGLEETFPASDPVAVSQTTAAGRPSGVSNQKPPGRPAGRANQKPPKKRP